MKMNLRLLAGCALACVLFAGCRTSPRLSNHIELLNAEKRALEDELYELEYDYEDALQELEETRLENDRLRVKSGAPAAGAPPTTKPRSSSPAKRKPNSGIDLSPPVVDEGTMVEPRIEMPPDPPARELPAPQRPDRQPGTSQRPPRNPPPSGANREVPTRLLTLEPADPRISHLHLNPLLTSGSDFDHKPGDEGLTVVIEPRNRDDVFVPLAGPVSIVLMDLSQQGDAQRFARWEIDANAAQQSLQDSSTVRGIQLRLPWPKSPPTTHPGRLPSRTWTLLVAGSQVRILCVCQVIASSVPSS